MGPIQSFDEFLSLLVRRWPLIALVCVVGAVLSVLVALSKPQVYESVAVIQVETP
ncbi:Wzz/FepE/Etk N-terminal domain-containing protein [Gemmobacter lanyuensis]